MQFAEYTQQQFLFHEGWYPLVQTITQLNRSDMKREKRFRKHVLQAVDAFKGLLDTHCANGDTVH
jgi:hypothetical protein